MNELWQKPLLLQEKLSLFLGFFFMAFPAPTGTVLEYLICAPGLRVKIMVAFGICHSIQARVSDPLPSLIDSGFVYLLYFGSVDGCFFNTVCGAQADSIKKVEFRLRHGNRKDE